MKRTMLTATAAAVAVAAFMAAAPATAHHSVYGAFDKDNSRAVKGVVKEVKWINPHIILVAELQDGKGGYTEWKLESQPVSFLRRVGVTKEMLLGNGKAVDMTILPPRKGDVTNVGFLIRLVTSDGKTIVFAPDK